MSAHIGSIARQYQHAGSGQDSAPGLGGATSQAPFSPDECAGIRFGRWYDPEVEPPTFAPSSGRHCCRQVRDHNETLPAAASTLLVERPSSAEGHRFEETSRGSPAAKACDAASSTLEGSKPSPVSPCLPTTALGTAQVERIVVCATNPAHREPAAENSSCIAGCPGHWRRNSVCLVSPASWAHQTPLASLVSWVSLHAVGLGSVDVPWNEG